MKLYETILKETNCVVIRVKANSAQEARDIISEFEDRESDYLAEELELNGNKEWSWSAFEEVHPEEWDERATITKNEDGSFDAQYEGMIIEME